MNAAEYAQYIYDLMVKCDWPYLAPIMEPEIPDCPPQIIVYDDLEMQIHRVISFADNHYGAEEALSFSRDTILNMDGNPNEYWPEAWWPIGGKIEGWGDEASPAQAE